MDKAILIDGNSLVFRAYFALIKMPYQMKTKAGIATGALNGFINMFFKIINANNYKYALVLFDSGKPSFRKDINENYKANRKKAPDDLISQFKLVYNFLETVNIKYEFKEGFEADDLIGSYANFLNDNHISVDIYTGDKDLLQLVNEKTIVNIMVKGAADIRTYSLDYLKKETGLTPFQYKEFMALTGDPSDNIKGVEGIGNISATNLLKEYGSVENIYNNLDNLKEKYKNALINGKDSLKNDLILVDILKDVPLKYNLNELENKLTKTNLAEFLAKYELNSILKRIGEL